MIPVTIAVIFIVYLIMYLTPGDPVALLLGSDATPELITETREKLGITDPFLVQFGRYLWNLLHGDFGMSWYTGNPVSERLFAAIPYTVRLSLGAMLVALIISVPLGVMAAVKRNSIADYAISIFAMIGVSAPTFWVGTMLILLFALDWRLLPSAFDGTFKSFILPTITQGFNMLASIVRTQRSSMLEVLSADYIRTARAKGAKAIGAKDHTIIFKHLLLNCMAPILVQYALAIGSRILSVSTLSYIGMGIQAPTPDWGNMLSGARAYIRGNAYLVLGPGIALLLTISAFNLIGDGLRDALDPRLKK